MRRVAVATCTAALALAAAFALARRRRRARCVDAACGSPASVAGSTAASASHECEEVLRFWFGGDVEELYATRWFVQAGSAAQAVLDADVVARFGALLRRAECGALDGWASCEPRAALALIVLLDQLSRHAHRAERPRIDANDVRALSVCEALLSRGWDTSLSTAELVFALMPLRHQATELRLQEVMVRSQPRLAGAEADARLLTRFMRATHLRLLHLQGQEGDPDDILEYEDAEHSRDQSSAAECAIGRTVDSFLRDQGLVPGGGVGAAGRGRKLGPRQRSRPAPSPTAVAAGPERVVDAHGAGPTPTLVVSLSGGVDSMVLVHLLLALRRKHGYTYRLVAVHIDYANRAESAAEAAYVGAWCAAREVICRTRRVEEVTRGITARDEYEKESRRIRFDSYVSAMDELGGTGVFFGHHRGDVHENVLSNVMKGANLLNVAGISAASVVSNVLILRPLLDHPKARTAPRSCLRSHARAGRRLTAAPRPYHRRTSWTTRTRTACRTSRTRRPPGRREASCATS